MTSSFEFKCDHRDCGSDDGGRRIVLLTKDFAETGRWCFKCRRMHLTEEVG